MARITIDEIEEVYIKYGVPVNSKVLIRTTINEGNLHNKLNTSCVTSLRNEFDKMSYNDNKNK